MMFPTTACRGALSICALPRRSRSCGISSRDSWWDGACSIQIRLEWGTRANPRQRKDVDRATSNGHALPRSRTRDPAARMEKSEGRCPSLHSAVWSSACRLLVLRSACSGDCCGCQLKCWQLLSTSRAPPAPSQPTAAARKPISPCIHPGSVASDRCEAAGTESCTSWIQRCPCSLRSFGSDSAGAAASPEDTAVALSAATAAGEHNANGDHDDDTTLTLERQLRNMRTAGAGHQ